MSRAGLRLRIHGWLGDCGATLSERRGGILRRGASLIATGCVVGISASVVWGPGVLWRTVIDKQTVSGAEVDWVVVASNGKLVQQFGEECPVSGGIGSSDEGHGKCFIL